MAKLIIPTIAFTWQGKRFNRHGEIVANGKRGKFHLTKIYHPKYLWAACGRFVEITDKTLIKMAISDIKAEDLCLDCLGAIKAVDEE